MLHLSFIIPAYNEAERIGRSLEQAYAYFSTVSYSIEIIVVNDGSRDTTSDIVQLWHKRWEPVRLLEQPHNMGKGAAVRRGMLEATGEYRIFSDADFSTPVRETERVLHHLYTDADICIGSRGIDTRLVKKHQPKYREMLGKMVNVVVQRLFIPGIADTQCGFKGFRAEVANRVFSHAQLNGWMFDLEALYIAAQMGYTIVEIPVEWFNDERSTVSVWHSWNILREFIAIKHIHRNIPRYIPGHHNNHHNNISHPSA